MRLLVLCTHNSARSQMAEGWLRHHAAQHGLEAEVVSAGTEASRVKQDAIDVMREVGIDISSQRSKTLYEVPDPWSFEVVLTVCDDANEVCPAYPATTNRLHVAFPDPTGRGVERWRAVRDAIGALTERLTVALAGGAIPIEEELLS